MFGKNHQWTHLNLVCFRRLLTIKSVSVIDIGLFKWSIFFLVCILWKLFILCRLSHLQVQSCSQDSLIILFTSEGPVLKSSLSFLMLLICVLSLFFLVSLTRSLPALVIFSKNHLVGLVDFLYSFSVFNFLIYTLIFISFLLLTLDLICSSFSSFLK